MEARPCLQIHQYNDPELLEFFNQHEVSYRLLGDHLFAVGHQGRELAAGPGDWLAVTRDGSVEVQRGDYAARARQALLRARRGRGGRDTSGLANAGAGEGARSPIAP